jgi:hypothetical protein
MQVRTGVWWTKPSPPVAGQTNVSKEVFVPYPSRGPRTSIESHLPLATKSRLFLWGATTLSCLIASGCVGTGRALTDRNVLSQDQLASTQATNLYEAIDLLRPMWLRPTARSVNVDTAVIVLVDGRYFGTSNTLSSIPSSEVLRVRYQSGGSGAEQVGRRGAFRHVAGVINVEMGFR